MAVEIMLTKLLFKKNKISFKFFYKTYLCDTKIKYKSIDKYHLIVSSKESALSTN